MKKDEFDDTLKKIGMTRQEFSNITKVAYSTIGNWHDEAKPIPGWVDSWLENYIDKKKYENIKNIIKDEL